MTSSGTSPKRFSPGFFPININLVGKRVLVVGAGQLALPKVSALLEFGAQVCVVAPIILAELEELRLAWGETLSVDRRQFGAEDEAKIASRDYLLVVVATNSEEENARVALAAKAAGVLVHVVGNIEVCDFVLPAVVKRGHLKISVGTDGLSPVVDRATLGRIDSSLGTEIDKYVLFVGFLKEKLVELEKDPEIGNPVARRAVARQLAESEEIFLAVQRENFDEAGRLVEMIINEARESARV